MPAVHTIPQKPVFVPQILPLLGDNLANEFPQFINAHLSGSPHALSPTIYFVASFGVVRSNCNYFTPRTSHLAIQSPSHHQLGYELAELVNFSSVGKDANFQVEDFLIAGLQNRQQALLPHLFAS